MDFIFSPPSFSRNTQFSSPSKNPNISVSTGIDESFVPPYPPPDTWHNLSAPELEKIDQTLSEKISKIRDDVVLSDTAKSSAITMLLQLKEDLNFILFKKIEENKNAPNHQ